MIIRKLDIASILANFLAKSSDYFHLQNVQEISVSHIASYLTFWSRNFTFKF